ncbi:Peptidyl-prolyl cis-trans isomerase [Hondaea fermentalgiana]|uniref:Peptidyl-prolyl cis-trans isomerase n=1 Tax=Hondaea fermentalgiana TaxID=2315210 RepID=A0A2R5GDR4_9STRA|nr:Peptidyl-prolyl cis-trans isomerase [Hondaea fermentalgiana]|eukprot:GBG27858.1 Peptidyl-prolyl cis-trans isomerase [Hondaea fermentalgiana]
MAMAINHSLWQSEKAGRVEVELADDIVPVTAENFLRLCDGDTALADEKFTYKGTELHQIMRDSWLLMGDVGHKDGRGGHSAFDSKYFDDEGYFFRHAKPGILSMANAGAHMNASCFFITLKPCLHLDGRHVPFGRVTSGMDVLEDLAGDLIVKGRPTSPIVISDCGSL